MWLDGSSLLWFHPLAFVLFVFISASLTALGVLVYLASLVFVAKSRQVDRAAKGTESHLFAVFRFTSNQGDVGHILQ